VNHTSFGRAGLVCCALSLSCATPTARTIEPNSDPAKAAGGDREDRTFVLSRKPPATPQPPPDDYPIHPAEKWWPFRADFLNIPESDAKERDNAVPERHAPDKFWDQQMAIEAVSVWSALCNECHGGRRRVEDAVGMPGPPAGWGKGEGLFFGTRKKYADVFNTIYKGGPERNGKPSEMPAWKGKLSKELIWSLLFFLEYQSGGIEGRFPPSLYPRREGELKNVLGR
jgi:hypothetical protein